MSREGPYLLRGCTNVSKSVAITGRLWRGYYGSSSLQGDFVSSGRGIIPINCDVAILNESFKHLSARHPCVV